MKELYLTAYQGSTQTLVIDTDIEHIDSIRAQVKRTKDGAKLAEFTSQTDGTTVYLTLDGKDTEKIDLIGDYEILYYDVYINDLCVLYGTIKMIKGVSCHG